MKEAHYWLAVRMLSHSFHLKIYYYVSWSIQEFTYMYECGIANCTQSFINYTLRDLHICKSVKLLVCGRSEIHHNRARNLYISLTSAQHFMESCPSYRIQLGPRASTRNSLFLWRRDLKKKDHWHAIWSIAMCPIRHYHSRVYWRKKLFEYRQAFELASCRGPIRTPQRTSPLRRSMLEVQKDGLYCLYNLASLVALRKYCGVEFQRKVSFCYGGDHTYMISIMVSSWISVYRYGGPFSP